jgi:hypothetical protein
VHYAKVAFEKYFLFAKVPGDEIEFIPLPEK